MIKHARTHLWLALGLALFACDDGAAMSSNTGGAGGMLAGGTGGSSSGGVGGGGTGGAGGTTGGSGGGAAGMTGGSGGMTGGSGGMTGGSGGAPVIDAGGDEPDASNGDCQEGEGTTEHFSFFVTSLAGLRRLSNSEDGFGGDLRFGKEDGLSGADEICRQLAETSYPGAGCKTWRAFLSVTAGPDGEPVHARDRIGEGPWYDRLGRLVAMDKDDLLQAWPAGADPAIMLDLPNEDGVPNHDPDGTGIVDNHNTVTGSAEGGMLYSEDWAFTCHDWTSKVGEDGTPMIGFSWMGGAGSFPGTGWYFSSGITEGGCAPIINLTDEMDFSIRGIGARGGYGGFYCLALEP
jgi:hypothetical protein